MRRDIILLDSERNERPVGLTIIVFVFGCPVVLSVATPSGNRLRRVRQLLHGRIENWISLCIRKRDFFLSAITNQTFFRTQRKLLKNWEETIKCTVNCINYKSISVIDDSKSDGGRNTKFTPHFKIVVLL